MSPRPVTEMQVRCGNLRRYGSRVACHRRSSPLDQMAQCARLVLNDAVGTGLCPRNAIATGLVPSLPEKRRACLSLWEIALSHQRPTDLQHCVSCLSPLRKASLPHCYRYHKGLSP
ncbi:hypothetical protein IG631_23336 [Alternaria alternata]|nr:hypothetical protein IG631_23336 [Alternaria alternata]